MKKILKLLIFVPMIWGPQAQAQQRASAAGVLTENSTGPWRSSLEKYLCVAKIQALMMQSKDDFNNCINDSTIGGIHCLKAMKLSLGNLDSLLSVFGNFYENPEPPATIMDGKYKPADTNGNGFTTTFTKADARKLQLLVRKLRTSVDVCAKSVTQKKLPWEVVDALFRNLNAMTDCWNTYVSR